MRRVRETPAAVRILIRDIKDNPALNAGVDAMRERKDEFSSPLAATLAGVAVLPDAHAKFNQRLDELWAQSRVPAAADEVIVGAGLHAAIYAATRVALGYPAPLVLEASDVAGGAFACSRSPSFYLNSRNRPGDLGAPGDNERALNVLPGAVVQPSDLSGAEYQRNNDLAFAIRATLACCARVATSRAVTELDVTGECVKVIGNDGDLLVEAGRVLDARGLGSPNRLGVDPDAHVLAFPEFMASMDSAWPLRHLHRVAVVGGGDSARTALEALVGQGPAEHWSVPSLDWVQRIDWYSPNVPATCQDYEAKSRTRYRKLGGMLPRFVGEQSRIRPYGVPGDVSTGAGCAWVNERAYDLVILCVGYDDYPSYVPDARAEFVTNGTRKVARCQGPVYSIGPRASLPVNSTESLVIRQGQAPENVSALFRYAGRTATLARMLSRSGSENLPLKPIGEVNVEIADTGQDLGAIAREAAARIKDPREPAFALTGGPFAVYKR